MLSNSLVAGLLATGYVVVLVLQLNPSLPLGPSRLMPLVATIGLFYAVHLTVMFYVLLVVRQLLATEVFSPAWVSIGVLVWLGAAASAAGAALIWGNLQTFTLVLEPATRGDGERRARAARGVRALRVRGAPARADRPRGARVRAARRPDRRWIDRGAAGVSRARRAAAARGASDRHGGRFRRGGTLRSRDHRGHRRRVARLHHERDRRRPSAELRADSRRRRGHAAGDAPSDLARGGVGRGGDGKAAAEERRAVGRRLSPRAAAAIRFSSCPTTASPTGSCGSAFLVEEPHTSATLRTRPFWGILSALGIPVGIVGWPLTDPASAVRGYLVSDQYDRVVSTPSGIADSSGVYPPDIQVETLSAIEETEAESAPALAASTLDPRFEAPARTDRAYEPHRAGAGAQPSGAGDRRPLSEPRSHRPPFSALRGAVGVRGRHRRGAAAVRRRARAALRGDRRRRSGAASRRSRPTIC